MSQPEYIKVFSDHYDVLVYVQPGARKDEIAGEHGGRLKIRLMAPPVDGSANKALLNFIRKKLKISASRIELVSGQLSRQKTIRISGIFSLNDWQ